MVNFTDITSITNLPWYITFILLIWIFTWKALALWKAAKKDHKIWFIILLVINSLGILEILYLFLFSDLHFGETEVKGNKPKKRKAK